MGGSIGDLASYIANFLDGSAPQPIWEVMREDERSSGFAVVVPGDTAWLSSTDWDETVVVSTDGKDVRLVAILAKRPGNGAFNRLIAGIEACGLRPVIVAPTREMAATCIRRGWTRSFHGHGFLREERWHPKRSATPTQSDRREE